MIIKYFCDRWSNPVYYDIPLLSMYMSDIETLIHHREIEFNGIYFLRFCTKSNSLCDFRNIVLNYHCIVFDKCQMPHKRRNIIRPENKIAVAFVSPFVGRFTSFIDGAKTCLTVPKICPVQNASSSLFN